MPIIDFENCKHLDFGSGDILVSPGLLKSDEVLGVVCFQRDGVHVIGEHTDHVPNKEVKSQDTPVRMTFDKVECIDVVIWALEETKKMMLAKSKE
jgi:hypothetical protein